MQHCVATTISVQSEHRSKVVSAPANRRAVQSAVGSFDQTRLRKSSMTISVSETAQNCVATAILVQAKNRSNVILVIATAVRRAIHHSVARFQQGRLRKSSVTSTGACESAQNRVACAIRVQLEY